jgi:hypothetical protein
MKRRIRTGDTEEATRKFNVDHPRLPHILRFLTVTEHSSDSDERLGRSSCALPSRSFLPPHLLASNGLSDRPSHRAFRSLASSLCRSSGLADPDSMHFAEIDAEIKYCCEVSSQRKSYVLWLDPISDLIGVWTRCLHFCRVWDLVCTSGTRVIGVAATAGHSVPCRLFNSPFRDVQEIPVHHFPGEATSGQCLAKLSIGKPADCSQFANYLLTKRVKKPRDRARCLSSIQLV